MQQKESKTNVHFRISMIKSGMRILACWFIYQSQLQLGAGLLFGAEILGILEEIF